MTITSRHKRYDLAERKAKAISRQFGGAEVIIQRRNLAGKFSKSGTLYTFVVKENRAVELILSKINLKEGKDIGESGEFEVKGNYSGPPEHLVRITIESDNGVKEIRKRVRYDEESDIYELDPGDQWETDPYQ